VIIVLDKTKAFFKRPRPEAKTAEKKVAEALKRMGMRVAQSRKTGPAGGNQGAGAVSYQLKHALLPYLESWW